MLIYFGCSLRDTLNSIIIRKSQRHRRQKNHEMALRVTTYLHINRVGDRV